MRFSNSVSTGKTGRAALRMSAAVFLGLATLAPLPAVTQDFSFDSVVVRGNALIETGTILTYLNLSGGQAVSGADVNDAVQRLRATGLFESVDASTEGGQLVVTVVEFPTIYRINIEGNSLLKDDALLPLLSSQERRVYNPATVEQDAAVLAQAYADKGRVNAVISPRLIRLPDNRVNVVFEVNESGVTEVEQIAFNGNTAFSDRRLRGILATKQAGALRVLVGSDTFVQDRIEFDKRVLTDFYQSRGYVDFTVNDVNVALTRGREAYQVTFDVTEGQQYHYGTVEVASTLADVDPALYQEVVRTKPGSTYSPVDLENDIARIEELAVRQGLQFVQVEAKIDRDPANQVLNVSFEMTRGPRVFVERIDIEGNNTTLDRVVRQQFRVVEGDPLNTRSIRQSAERIRALGYFADASVQARQGSSEDQVVVDVNVTEQPTGSLSFGVNYSTDGGLSLVASFKEANFLGRGQKFNLSVSTAETNKLLSFSFAEPYLLGRDLEAGFDLNYRLTDNESATYDTETFSIKPGMTFSVSDRGRLSTYLIGSYSDITNVSTAGDVSPYILSDAAEDGRWSGGLGYAYNWSSRRDGLDEKSSYVLRFGQQAGFGDNQYLQTTALAGAETKVLGEDVTLRATVEGGFQDFYDGTSLVTDRFFLSSSQMRGFDRHGMGPRYYDASGATLIDDPLGGNAYAVARLEAEFPLGLPEEYGIHGGLFYDYGSLWDTGLDCGADANLLYCDFTPRGVAGASVFWDTPLGPLRFNWTWGIETEEHDETSAFDVTISASF